MKLVTFSSYDRTERLGVLGESGIVDLLAAGLARGAVESQRMFADALTFLEGQNRARDLARETTSWALTRAEPGLIHRVDLVTLLAPVPRPPKILCLAGNYAEHWREGGAEAPPKNNHTPEVFLKPVTTIVGPGAPIRLPGAICTAVDYEGELAVVVGRSARNIPVDRAFDYIAGYSNFNDVSGRKLTLDVSRQPTARTGWFDWLNGKWFDTFGPLGPYLAIDEITNPGELAIQTRVNGAIRQTASTGDMIFTIAETIAWMSSFVTLEPGDIIATGTPSGVGATTGTYLQAGDVVEVEVAGLGVLRNPVASP